MDTENGRVWKRGVPFKDEHFSVSEVSILAEKKNHIYETARSEWEDKSK